MTPLSKEDFGMDIKGEVLLQLFNKSKLRNGIKTFLERKFFSIVKFKKLGFSTPLSKYFYLHKFFTYCNFFSYILHHKYATHFTSVIYLEFTRYYTYKSSLHLVTFSLQAYFLYIYIYIYIYRVGQKNCTFGQSVITFFWNEITF